MNDLGWRIRRACARWLLIERRMDYVAEEVAVGVADYVSGHRSIPTRDPVTGDYNYAVRTRAPVTSAARQVDVVGYTAADPARNRRRELRIIEVKVSRGDLAVGVRGGQIVNGPGGLGSVADYAHLAVGADVPVDFADLPPGWGLIRASVTPVGSRTGEQRTAVTLAVEKAARRMTPTYDVDDARLVRAVIQSCLYRLYDPLTELVVRRYTEEWDHAGPRVIAAG